MSSVNGSFPFFVTRIRRPDLIVVSVVLALVFGFPPGYASLFGSIRSETQGMKSSGGNFDDFELELRDLSTKADEIAEIYSEGGSVAVPIKEWMEVWEVVEIHEVIEAKVIHLYPPIWQGIYAMQKVAEKGGSSADMRAAAEKTKAALWQSLGGLRALAELPAQATSEAHLSHADHGTGRGTESTATVRPLTDNIIELTGDDNMRFNKTHFVVKVGEPVTLRFKNIGELPKEVMGHNVVVLKRGTPIEPFGLAAAEAPGNDFIPTAQKHAEKIIAHTELLGPDGTDTITFTLEEPGAYPFICSFIAHFRLMKGSIEAVVDPTTQPVDAILHQLQSAVDAYAEGEHKRAQTLVQGAYMNIFEGLEGDLIEKEPELVSQLELDFNAGLPMLFQENASMKEVRTQLEAMRQRLHRAKGILADVEANRSSVF